MWTYSKKIGEMTAEQLKERIKKVMLLDTASKMNAIPFIGTEERVTYKTNELVARCPETGIIDFYKLRIVYTPDKLLPELKSYKYYLIQFEEIPISHEQLAEKLYQDFLKTVKPKQLYLQLEVNVRGGIKTYVTKGEL